MSLYRCTKLEPDHFPHISLSFYTFSQVTSKLEYNGCLNLPFLNILKSTGWHNSDKTLYVAAAFHFQNLKACFCSRGLHNLWVKMPWPFSESIKKRACRYLLHRYLGNFLEEKLSLDQLSLDLYQGTGSLSQVPLDKWVCVYLLEITLNEFWILTGSSSMMRNFSHLICFSVTEWTPGDSRCPIWSHYWVYPDNFFNCPVGSPSAGKLCPRSQRVRDGVQTKTKSR